MLLCNKISISLNGFGLERGGDDNDDGIHLFQSKFNKFQSQFESHKIINMVIQDSNIKLIEMHVEILLFVQYIKLYKLCMHPGYIVNRE